MKVAFMKKKYCIFSVLLLFVVYMYNIGRVYSFEIVPDEFGYWSYAASLAGYDWFDVTTLGSYYSFGYTLLLYPILCLFEDSVVAYRAAVTVNYLLIIIAFFLLRKLLKSIMSVEREKSNYDFVEPDILAAIAVFYSSWLYYARTTLTEILVMFLYIVVCLLMYQYLRKKSPLVFFSLIITLVYLYTVHMRTVGILIAAVMVLFVKLISDVVALKKQRDRKGSLIVAVLIVVGGIVLFAIADECKQLLIEFVYEDSVGTGASANDYSGQIHKIKSLLSPEGIKKFFISFVGKLAYLGMASFGLFYFGIAFCVRKLKNEKQLFYLFVLLATVGEICITAIYTINMERIDNLTYGRYNEQILPVLMMLGCVEILHRKKVIKEMIFIAVAHGAAIGLLIYTILKYKLTGIHAFMILGMSYLYKENDFEPIRFHATAYIFSLILTGMVLLFLKLAKRKQTGIFLMMIVAVEVLLGMSLINNMAEATQMANYRDNLIIDAAREKLPEYARLVYLQEDGYLSVENLRFRMREEPIVLETELDEVEAGDLVITDYRYSRIEELKETFENWRVMGHLGIFYN